jgi:lysophospholipase L1-like esterase
MKKVVCFGDSITRGVFSHDWVGYLAKKLAGRKIVFANHGRDGELAYNALQRLKAVSAEDPDYVVVLLGTNDVNATLNESSMRRYIRGAKLPQAPCLAWYTENLRDIIAGLQRQTTARIAIVSPPVLGETLHGWVNERVSEYAAAARTVAVQSGAHYLPLNETMAGFLAASPSVPTVHPPVGLGFLVKVACRRFLLRQDWNQISSAYGMQLSPDCIHLNQKGGIMLAEMVENFLLDEAVGA